MTHALIPGSFDPMTLGHLDIVKRARKHYEKVTVAVMINENKNTRTVLRSVRKWHV